MYYNLVTKKKYESVRTIIILNLNVLQNNPDGIDKNAITYDKLSFCGLLEITLNTATGSKFRPI